MQFALQRTMANIATILINFQQNFALVKVFSIPKSNFWTKKISAREKIASKY